MRKILTLVLTVFFFSGVFCPQAFCQPGQEKVKIAFLEFEAVGISSITVGTISDEFRKQINKLDNYFTMSGSRVKEIMKEKAPDMAAPITEVEDIIKVGKLLDADQVISGSVSKVGDAYSISVQLIDLKTKESREEFGTRTGSLTEFVTITVKEVAEKIVGYTPPIEEPVFVSPITTEKKPWYKKWYVWAGGGGAAIVVAAVVLTSGNGGVEDKTLPGPPEFP